MPQVRLEDTIIRARSRQDLGDIPRLAESIERLGRLQPIVLRPDNTLVAWERRIAAFRHLGRDAIPAVIAEGLDDALHQACERPGHTRSSVP